MIRYAATTRDITVTVHPIYLDEPSNLLEHRFYFEYAVHVANTGPDEVQLLRQDWSIQDADGRTQQPLNDIEVQSRPVVAPGNVHTFEGSCTLDSFEGVVEGTYLVQRPNGEQFRVSVPSFHLQAAAN
jgi:ApaG protein